MKLKLFGKDVFELSAKSKVDTKRKLSYANHNIEENLPNVNLKMLRKIVTREPLLYKAIWKKNKDTFKNWFNIYNPKLDEPLEDKYYDIIKTFDVKTNILSKFTIAGVSANIYGTGFIEKVYENDPNSVDEKPADSAKLVDLHVLNSENMVNIGIVDEKKDDVEYYHYNVHGTKKYIHPDRIEKIIIDELPFSAFGISKVSLLFNILKSKMNFDVSSGEYLNWGGLGLFDLKIEGMTDEQEDAAKKILKKHPDFIVHDEDYELKVENPKSLDPKEYADYFYVNIASALEMPKQMLIGGDIGNITGSEVGLSSYYSDIENIQKIISKSLTNIYEELIYRMFGKKIELVLDWNEIFVDELSEAKILQTRSYSAVQCVNAMNPIISIEEARKMLRDGHIELDPSDVPEVEPAESKTPDPNVAPQPTVKDPEQSNNAEFKELSPYQKRMIEIERAIGEKELVEQEKRCNESTGQQEIE
jgi:hypothetical protein